MCPLVPLFLLQIIDKLELLGTNLHHVQHIIGPTSFVVISSKHIAWWPHNDDCHVHSSYLFFFLEDVETTDSKTVFCPNKADSHDSNRIREANTQQSENQIL